MVGVVCRLSLGSIKSQIGRNAHPSSLDEFANPFYENLFFHLAAELDQKFFEQLQPAFFYPGRVIDSVLSSLFIQLKLG
jgi:hypothetical protein